MGLVLVVYSVLFFDEYTPFPSLYALLPTIGTALLVIVLTYGISRYLRLLGIKEAVNRKPFFLCFYLCSLLGLLSSVGNL